MRRYQRIIIGFSLILNLVSACIPNPSVEKEIENASEPEPTATLVEQTEAEEIIEAPIPVIDVSGWVVTIGGLECSLEPYGNEFPGWYTIACPEQLWLPMGQTTTIELNLLDNETCIISPIDDFEIAIQDISIDAKPVEFIQIADGGWGCQIPYSDTTGIEVVCGFECEGIGKELRVLIFGKTMRANTGGNSLDSDNTGNGGNQSVPEDPKPPWIPTGMPGE